MGSRHVTAGNGERANIVICFFYPSYTSAILFAVLLFFSPAFYRSFFSCRISVSSCRPSPRGGEEGEGFLCCTQARKKKHSPPSLTAREEEEEEWREQKNAPVGNESVAGEKGEGLFLPLSCFSPRRHFLAPPTPLLSESGKNVAPAKAKKEKGEVDESAPPPRPCA